MPYALLVVVLLSNCGCKALQTVVFGTKPAAPLPIVFATTPTLEQVKEEFNKRYANLQSLSTNTATFSASSFPISMKYSTIAYQKPKRLRVYGGASFGMGTEFDLGSNDELFWFWVKRSEPKAMYYANHREFAGSATRSIIPIEPEWLIESFGIIELKESDIHEGPRRDKSGNLQITSFLNTPRGRYSRIVTFNPQTGAILSYEIYAPNGQPFVGAILSDHQVDPIHGILYAKKIVITCPEANETISINLGNVSFNSTSGFNAEAFVMPTYKDYIPIDLCSPEYQRQFAPGQQLLPQFPATAHYPETTYQNSAYREEELVGAAASSSVYVRPR
ncbi:MAG: hypothetical protein FWC43_02220 [Planctomycetaceae bacterium]|nr:hypothetical protein [Planctomycetaceae bacterium]